MGNPKTNQKQSHVYFQQPLSPLMEGPDLEPECEGSKKEKTWEVIRTWVRLQRGLNGSHWPLHHDGSLKRVDLRLILGVLGCPLSPIPLPYDHDQPPTLCFPVKDNPIETSSARYIIHQYLAATGCSKIQHTSWKSMYVTGSVKMAGCEAENGMGTGTSRRSGGGKNGCFVLWQMSPGMWLVEMVVAGYKVVAGSNGKIVWRHLPWHGLNAAKGPQRPLRRIIQGLDPTSIASMFTKAQCLGEKRINGHDCFVLKVSADRASVAERGDEYAEVIRHVLYGYFNQKSGLLVYIEDSHLTRTQTPAHDAMYWETTIGTTIEDYREIDGVLIAHRGRSVATLFRFGEVLGQNSKTRMEETWKIDDVVFNVPGLSVDCFIPPTEILSLGDGL